MFYVIKQLMCKNIFEKYEPQIAYVGSMTKRTFMRYIVRFPKFQR